MISDKQKIVGVVGGMGPFATVSFFQKLVDLTPAKKDWEHLRILIDCNVKIPSRTRSILYGEMSPAPRIIESIKGLASIGADFIAMPCNSACYFLDDILPKIKIPLLNLVDITSQEIKKLGLERPLILGGYITTQKKLYSKYLPGAVYPQKKWAKNIFDVIEEIKLDPNDIGDGKYARVFDLISYYKNQIDSIVLACTELSIVFHYSPVPGIPMIDSTYQYAKATVVYARGENGN